MSYKPEDFRGRNRDPKWERELADWLRTRPESERLQFIMDLLPIHGVALQLAHKTLTHHDSFKAVLEFGLREADVSSIRSCLDVTIPRMGFRRFAQILRDHVEEKPHEVEKTLYWLRRYAKEPGYSADLANELREAIHVPNR